MTSVIVQQQVDTMSHSPIELLRKACLRRGVHGIAEMGRTFRIYDRNSDRSIGFEELRAGLSVYGVELEDTEIQQIFHILDKDESGLISFQELLEALRPPMSGPRQKLIDMAFAKIDKTGDGVITVADLTRTYDVSKHNKYMSGQWSKQQVLQEFLDQFQKEDRDAQVTKEEFYDYYSGVSASIDKDVYFDYMMRRAWKL